jgi:hypothetical protein
LAHQLHSFGAVRGLTDDLMVRLGLEQTAQASLEDRVIKPAVTSRTCCGFLRFMRQVPVSRTHVHGEYSTPHSASLQGRVAKADLATQNPVPPPQGSLGLR